MRKLRFVVSLTTHDNDYQMEQAAAAQDAAHRVGVDIEIIYAENDAIQQSQQLLQLIQSKSALPDGIICEPVGGTGFPLVARAAAAAGVGWVVMHREVDYLADLRRSYKIPIFTVTPDHEEIGRIQGRQITALLPAGGTVLLIQGPSESLAAKQRTAGLYDTKPIGVQVKTMKGNWTEAGAYKAVSSWLKLSTSQQTPLDIIAAQNDVMALGARKAIQEIPDASLRDKFLHVPFLGIDGVRSTGQGWLKRGLISATVVVPTSTDVAIQMLAHAVQTGTIPPEKTTTDIRSLPAIEELAKHAIKKTQAAGA